MNHLDEGTIHAWLDGALDATESAGIEAHVASCAPCAAAVAEARGFIAGASRILGALDEVPGGVLPARPAAPVMPPAAHAPQTRTARRRWRAAPWVTGIAAVLMAAVVLRTGTMASRKEMPMESQRAAVPVPASATDSTVSTAADLATAASAGQGVASVRPPAVTPEPTDRAIVTPQPEPGRRIMAANDVANQQRIAVGAGGRAAGGAEGGAARTEGAAPPTATEVARAPLAVDTTTLAAKSARLAEVASRPQAELSQVVVTSVAVDNIPWTGCYRLVPAREERRLGAVTGAVAEAAAAQRTRAARPAPSAPAAAPSSRADYSVGRVPSLIRLDTARAALGLSVMDAATGAPTGWWRVLLDSARVDLGTRGVFMLARTQRVECPETRP